MDLTSKMTYRFVRVYEGVYCFSTPYYTNKVCIETYMVASSNSVGTNVQFENSKYPAVGDFSTAVVANGRTLRVYY